MKSSALVALWLSGAVLAVTPAFSWNAPDRPAHDGISSSPPVLADDEEPAPPAREEIQPKEEKDPNDLRNALDNLSLVRDMKKLAKPVQGGLWQQYVDQPYFTPEMRAEKLLFHGQYEDAEKAFRDLLKKGPKDQDKADLQMGLLGAILNQGRERDLERFSKVLAEVPDAIQKTPRALSLRAQALVLEGKVPEARTLLREYVTGIKDLKPIRADVLQVMNQYAEMLERQSNYAGAKAIYAKIKELEKEELPASAAVHTEIINAIYRIGVLSAEKQSKRYALTRLAKVFEDDPTYWPAYLLSGKILLGSHNEKDGGARINDVFQRNPNNLDALYLKFDFAVEGYKFEDAEKVLDEIKDRSESARVFASEGRLLLKKRTPEKALGALLEAVKKDPTMPEARGWLAATYYLLNDTEKATAQLESMRIESRIHPVTVFEAGEVLRDARQFPLAEKLYQQARDAAAWWSEPGAALAQLYLETGHEDKAREEYDKSFAIDPTNVRALNQLKLLEEFMKDFKELKSSETISAENKAPRFVVKCSPEDEVMGKMALEWMERVYPEVTGYFQHTPTTTTIIELFPNHDQFGVRTTGLPWIGTVGACTGNVIAMDVPRGQAKNMMGTFDWARVLRHEYTHAVTLSMTNNRIPHWLTEGAACEQELSPRDWDNCQLLASNYRAGTLFNLDTLTWGFIRPKRSIDRRLAYMQSQWVYQYLVETYGQPKMLEFLRAFGQGKTEAQAWRAVYGKPMDVLNKDFMTWAGKQIEAWGLPSNPLPKQADLEKKLKDNPNDAQAHFDLAWLLVNQPRGLAKAKEHLELAQKADPKNTKVRELLGAVLNNMAKRSEAKEILTKVVAEDDQRVVAFRTLGLIAMSEKDFDAAEKWFVKLQALRPAEDTSYKKLAGIYLLRKDTKKAIGQFAKLQMHEQHDEVVPRQLAILYKQEGQLSEAESSAYRAIRINPYSAVNHHQYAQILMLQRAQATSDAQKIDLAKRAAEHWTYAAELQPRIAEFWVNLAEAHAAAGNPAAATAAAKKAVELQPNSPAKKWIE